MSGRINYYGNIVLDSLSFFIDPAKRDSYLGTGTSSRDLRSGLSCELKNGVSYSTDNFGSWVFDGVDDYILLPTNIYTQNNSAFSVSVWFKSTATAGGTMLGQQNNNDPSLSSGFVPAIYLGTTGLIRTEVFWTNSAANTYISTVSYNDGLWHQVCVTYANGTQSTYIDGVLSGKVTGKNQVSYTSTYYYFLGAGYAASRGLGGNYFNGSIAQFAFYNRLLSSIEVERNYNSGLSRNPYIYDFNARAFFAISGITNSTIISAINTLVLDLKGNGIWYKMRAVYPFVGGSAALHKWNLKDPRDSNEAFRLTFAGGWTHSSSGSTPNGINGNCNTYVSGNVDISLNDAGMGVYFRTNVANTGAFGIGGTFHIHPRWTNNLTYWRIATTSTGGVAFDVGSSLGLIHGYSNAGNSSTAFNNATKRSTFTGNQALATSTVIFGGGMPGYAFDPREIAFAFVSGGLSDTEAASLYTIVQNFQTTLGRQV